MTSGFVFEEGEAIDVGSHGDHDFVFHEGEPVPDTGISTLVFEEGTGIGGVEGIQVTISDTQGETTGTVQVVEKAKDVVEYYHGSSTTGSNAGSEFRNDFSEDGTTVFLVYRNANTGEYTIVCHYASDLDEHASHDGIPSGGSFVIRDDDSDSYSISPPTASTAHSYGVPNNDGFGIGRFSTLSTTYKWELTGGSVEDFANPDCRVADLDGNEVRRPFVEGETTVELEVNLS